MVVQPDFQPTRTRVYEMPDLSRLRILCPICKAGELALESMTESEICCTCCNATFPVTGGVINLLYESRHRGSLSQAFMEWKPFVRIYESKWFRKGHGFPLISGISFEQEYQLIIDNARLENDGILLDLGCGTGIYSRPFAQRLNRGIVVGLDLSIAMLNYAISQARDCGIQNLILMRGNAMDLPFPSAQFDVVNCCATIHLFSTPGLLRVLQEVRRVLKRHGRFMISCLRNWIPGRLSKRVLNWYSEKVGTYYRRPDELEILFKQAGLDEVTCLHAKRYWTVMSAIRSQ
jgi:SAM-dependent methyltransferase/uncharacterized protein YbaR (Trm112 family)